MAAGAARKPPEEEDFNSDQEEAYFNIDTEHLNEAQNLMTHRGQIVKTFKPGTSS
jgi:hypothetical protein